MKDFKGKKIAILGLGLEGKDLVSYLLDKGAQITVFDKKNEEEIDFAGIEKSKLTLKCGKDYLLDELIGFDIIFRSPGVYRYLAQIIKAEKKGVKISSAIKLFFDLCPAKIIGVTGTKGKGTTTTLIYQILKSAGKNVYLAGNIGTAYLSLLPKLRKSSFVVLELSSFQLIDLEKSPNIAVVLNITIDHMDWHKDLEEYINAKKNIVKYQKPKDFAVINADYEVAKNFATNTKAKVVFFSRNVPTNGSFVENDEIILPKDNDKVALGKSYWLKLRGEHNLENVTAAISVASVLEIKEEIIKKVVFSFGGLEHRLEVVANIGGVSFYNDSFATGPQPTIAAVRSFEEPITAILGGSDKNLDFTQLGKVISKKKNLKCVILIGTVAEKIKIALKNAKFKGKIIEMGKKSMEKIVQEAFSNTPKGGVVLLSPAAASFDMFKNYKDRGNQFKKAVKELV